MNFSFHYYGTYCAAREAGFDSDNAWVIAHAAQFVDECSNSLLKKHGLENACPTYHTNEELIKMNVGWFNASFPNEIPQVWTSFHFLPGNFTEEGHYRIVYRNPKNVGNAAQTSLFKLMCLPYGHMTGKIIDAAKSEYQRSENTLNKKLCYIGMVMHVLADTFSHEYFVGMPSEAINDATWITEFEKSDDLKPYGLSNIRGYIKKEKPYYLYAPAFSSTSVGWLGHGRVGIYPDVPNKKYYYNPNWNPDAECIKDNPISHLCAFDQMTNAMKFIINSEDVNNFNYQKELTQEEYSADNSSKLLKIFNSDGDENNQKIQWSQHILDTYSTGVLDHDVELLASDKIFLNDFSDNAYKHRKIVCDYCRNITAPVLKYF